MERSKLLSAKPRQRSRRLPASSTELATAAHVSQPATGHDVTALLRALLHMDHMQQLLHGRRFSVQIDPATENRIEHLRSAASLGAAAPSRSSFAAELIRRGLEQVEREVGIDNNDRKAA